MNEDSFLIRLGCDGWLKKDVGLIEIHENNAEKEEL